MVSHIAKQLKITGIYKAFLQKLHVSFSVRRTYLIILLKRKRKVSMSDFLSLSFTFAAALLVMSYQLIFLKRPATSPFYRRQF